MLANRSILKCNTPDPHRVDNDGSWEPLGYPYQLPCGVYHQSTTLYTTVLMHQSTTLYAEVLTNQSYELCGGVYHQCTTTYAAVLTRQCSTSYAEVSYTEALRMLQLLCQGCENTLWCLHQCCGILRCLLLASKPMLYGGVYYFSAEVLQPEVSDSTEGC